VYPKSSLSKQCLYNAVTLAFRAGTIHTGMASSAFLDLSIQEWLALLFLRLISLYAEPPYRHPSPFALQAYKHTSLSLTRNNPLHLATALLWLLVVGANGVASSEIPPIRGLQLTNENLACGPTSFRPGNTELLFCSFRATHI